MKNPSNMSLDECLDELAFGSKAIRRRIQHRETHPHNGSEFDASYDEVIVNGKRVWNNANLEPHPIFKTLTVAADIPSSWIQNIHNDGNKWWAAGWPRNTDPTLTVIQFSGETELLARFRLKVAINRIIKNG
jgi:hypothetical protein